MYLHQERSYWLVFPSHHHNPISRKCHCSRDCPGALHPLLSAVCSSKRVRVTVSHAHLTHSLGEGLGKNTCGRSQLVCSRERSEQAGTVALEQD